MAQEKKYDFGIIGLGTMGHNLLLNMVDHGFSVAGYDKDVHQVELLKKNSQQNRIKGFTVLADFLSSLQTPRAVMMLVPAGKIVDQVIAQLMPLMEIGDILMDGGNSHFPDTDRRIATLAKQGVHFLGIGISGGEAGARFGPSLMPGGTRQAYEHIKPICEAIAAKVENEPCVTYIGAGSSGHFVKMVHNGIEYALMQLIAKTYNLLKKGMQLENAAIHNIFKQWNQSELQSYLLEITAKIFAFKDVDDEQLLLDKIKDEAKSKGTGKWTSQVAMDLAVPIPVIDVAVSMRDLSKYKSLRTETAAIYAITEPPRRLLVNKEFYINQLQQAFYFSMIITYAQGMHLLYKASEVYDYHLELDQIAKIWRGGCIIRAKLLDIIHQAYQSNPYLENLLTDSKVGRLLKENLSGMRSVVSVVTSSGLAIPAYAASLSYFDMFCTKNMPSNLIQAQRDFFGAHGYELKDKEGIFHTDWANPKK